MDGNSGDRASPAVTRWRESIERTIRRTAAALAVSIAIVQVVVLVSGRDWQLFPFYGAGAALFLALAVLGSRIPWLLRTSLLFSTMLAIVGAAIWQSGFRAPNAFVGMLAILVLCALLLPGRALAWLALLCVVIVGAAAWRALAHPVGIAEVGSAGDWARVTMLFLCVSAGTLWAVRHFTGGLERALAETDRLLASLGEETAQRLKDADEKRELEAQLWQVQRLEALGRLSGGVAHDFNNLLSIVLNGTEAAGATSDSDARRRLLDEVIKAARRGQELTRQLLSFSGQSAERAEPMNFNFAVAETIDMVKRIMSSKIDVRVDLAPNVGEVVAVPVQISQLIMNLAVNSRDAMPDGGVLNVVTELTTHGDRPFVRLTVSDSGSGMTQDQQRRVFDPFFTTKAPGKGSGLGLSVVHGIVTGLGGHVEVASAPGRGTSFSIRLPVAQNTSAGAVA